MADRQQDLSVYVFQMGKVASTAIVDSLKELGVDVWQPHYLKRDAFYALLKRFDDPDLIPFTVENLVGQMAQNLRLYHRLVRYRAYGEEREGPLRIITLTREPFSWYLSNLAQNFEEYRVDIEGWAAATGLREGQGAGVDAELVKRFVEAAAELLGRVVERFDLEAKAPLRNAAVRRTPGHRPGDAILVKHAFAMLRPHIWFGEHFEPAMDFDPMRLPFDPRQGWRRYDEGICPTLLLRFEQIREIGEEVIRDFLALPAFRLVERNVTERKESGLLIREVREMLRLPETFLEKAVASPYMQHFYAGEETERFLERYGNER